MNYGQKKIFCWIGFPVHNKLILISRKSPLAQWQAAWVKEALHHHYPDLHCELITRTTTGDHEINTSGKDWFVKDLETALLNNEADVAIHSLKDMATTTPTGLCLAAIPPREDPRDVLL